MFGLSIVKTSTLNDLKEKSKVSFRLTQLYWLHDYMWVVKPIVEFLTGKTHIPEHMRVHIDNAHSTLLHEKQARINELESENWKLSYANQQLLSAINIVGEIQGFEVTPIEINESDEEE